LPLTIAEIRHLLFSLVFFIVHPVFHIISWSFWRRHHQALAKFFHYKRRLAPSKFLAAFSSA